MVPDRLNALAGGLEPAELLACHVRPGPPVLQGPAPAQTPMWTVRYLSDRSVEDVPEGAVRPLLRFQVVITEIAAAFEAPVKPGDPTPVIRDVSCVCDAVDETGAQAAGRAAWAEKYGADAPPRGGEKIQVIPLSS